MHFFQTLKKLIKMTRKLNHPHLILRHFIRSQFQKIAIFRPSLHSNSPPTTFQHEIHSQTASLLFRSFKICIIGLDYFLNITENTVIALFYFHVYFFFLKSLCVFHLIPFIMDIYNGIDIYNVYFFNSTS